MDVLLSQLLDSRFVNFIVRPSLHCAAYKARHWSYLSSANYIKVVLQSKI